MTWTTHPMPRQSILADQSWRITSLHGVCITAGKRTQSTLDQALPLSRCSPRRYTFRKRFFTGASSSVKPRFITLRRGCGNPQSASLWGKGGRGGENLTLRFAVRP